MSILLDGIIILLFVIFIVDGFKRGVVKSVLDLVGAALALILASYLSSQLSELIFNSFIRESLLNNINIALSQTNGEDINSQIEAAFYSLPNFILNTLSFYKVTPQSLASSISISVGGVSEQILDNISPMIINLIRTALVSLLFIIFVSFVGVLSRTLNRVFKLPLLKQVNEIMGAVFGALKCVIILMVVILIIRVLIPFFNNVPDILEEHTIQSTYIFKNIYNNNPLYLLFQF